jgi:hypothetical protein
MAGQDLPQRHAIRRFQALLDSIDHPHDPEYHWLWNERRHPDQPPQGVAEGPDASSPERNRRITDRWYDEIA